MIDLEEIKSRINPQYADRRGSESHERKMLCDEIESLRQRLAEKDAEIELERTARQQVEKLLHKQAETIAASQLQNTQLREVVDKANGKLLAATMCHQNAVGVLVEEAYQVTTKALSLPQDTTALEAIKAQVAHEAGEVMRQRAILPFIQDHCEYFGREITDAIRALPGVTLEDIKNG